MSEQPTAYRVYAADLDDGDDAAMFDTLTQGLARVTCPASLPARLRALASLAALAAEDATTPAPHLTPGSALRYVQSALLRLAEEVQHDR